MAAGEFFGCTQNIAILRQRRIGVSCWAMGASLLRQLTDNDVKCPAGERVGDASVFCGIEEGLIDGRTSPEAVEGFCCGEHLACPSWRLEKKRVEEGKKPGSFLAEARSNALKTRARSAEQKKLRFDRARELLVGDSEEARRFRARTGLGRKAAADGFAEVIRRTG